MTGLECLYEELQKRGYKKQQIVNLKIIPVLLDIISNSGGMYQELDTLQKDVNRLKREKKEAENELSILESSISSLEWNIQHKADSCYKQAEEYISKFFDALNSCETPEARDALKTAQMFVNSVDVETKYDNTAFIIGLSAILTRGAVAPVDELRKINKKIPEMHLTRNPVGYYTIEEKTL